MRIIKSTAALLLCFTMLALCACSAKQVEEPSTSQYYEEENPLTVMVTIPEGTSCTQIATILEEKGVCSAQDFISACQDRSNLSLLPVSIDNADERAFLLEGYIFPDTYEFYTGSSGQSALQRFIDNANKKLRPEYAQKAAEMGFTLDEIIIIASIIQEEAGNPKDMNGVSSVIHNRLESPDYPYIQCDVAIRYLEDYVKPYFTEEEYSEICMKYNIVSKRKGLPAGAITNPGTAAIEAALNPTDTPYYYFVTDSDANYYFAETYSEHRVNCHTAGIAGY